MSTETNLSTQEIIRAATNDPALSDVMVELGDRKFKIVDLSYDDYLVFLSRLQPVLSAVAGPMMGEANGPELSAATLLKYCADVLPELAQLVCKQTDPTITVDEVKRLGRSPFKLAAVVLKQIEQNKMISDITDFFVQIRPLLMMGKTTN